ncbi:glycosyltransferase family 4 protein [Aliiroseovarius subalbicans]|uniref:glycosyltransferase family 4 protein n=1 Tax=Aliiroseovarius subalbicans TaxID=2925840 RepID=UPI001F585CFD|nr:glycosyltransferase family 4 protein [Aliiroseovarius subalbicans]MCI2397793.1 glycosyltransferase family 4 protein [Aliiroseovarius subalbicans]
MGGRHHYFSLELARRGHSVTLVGAQRHHLLLDGADAAPGIEMRDGYRFVRVPVPGYAHAHDKKRILNWLLFSKRLRHLPKRLGEIPDTILYSSPSLLGFRGAERLARKVGARLVFEVRDIWPLTLQEVGGKPPSHPLIRWMQRVEDRAYRVSDAVISNLPNAVDHMEMRGLDREKFTWVPNGFSLEETSNPEPLGVEISDALPKGKFLVGYAGTIGAANALDTMLDAAAMLKEHEDIAFVVVGSGRERRRLQAEAERRKLRNVNFFDPVAKRQIQSLLTRFDACFLLWNDTPLYRFGTSANKMFDYLFSGRPVLNGYSGQADPVIEYGAGLSFAAGDARAFSEAVLTLKNLPGTERAAMGARGHAAALEYHEYGMLAQKLEPVLCPWQMQVNDLKQKGRASS